VGLTLTLHPYRFALRRPLRTARGTIDAREGLWVGLGGGHGDAAPLAGFSGEDLAEVHAALDALASLPAPLTHRLERAEASPASDLPAALAALEDWFSNAALPPSAAHGLEQAALVHVARSRGLTLAALLAAGLKASPRHEVALSTLIDGPDAARAACARGARCLKLKVGVVDLDEDVDRVFAVREAVGPQPQLRLDANGAWSRDVAAAALARLAVAAPECVEQPVATEDVEGLAWLRARSPVAIAADESLRDLADARQLLTSAAVDCLIIKPQLCGGLLAARRICLAAAEAGLAVAISCSLESQLGCLGALALAAACPATLWPCGLFPALLPDSELPARLRGRGSLRALSIAETPGLPWCPPPTPAQGRS
jgi:o-succinylbenzoate synthase